MAPVIVWTYWWSDTGFSSSQVVYVPFSEMCELLAAIADGLSQILDSSVLTPQKQWRSRTHMFQTAAEMRLN